MAIKTEISKSSFEKILTEYDLGNLVETKPFSSGCVQTNLLLETSKGKFAFRLYENRSREYNLFELNILYYFNKHLQIK